MELECLKTDGITEAAKRARREYHNKWRKEHPEKVKEYNNKYWNKKAAEAEAAEEEKETAANK